MNQMNVEWRKSFHKDDATWWETPYVNGMKHGIETIYGTRGTRNGKVVCKRSYANGKRHGIERWFYLNGNVRRECPYINGQKHGIYRHYYDNGSVMNEIKCVNDIEIMNTSTRYDIDEYVIHDIPNVEKCEEETSTEWFQRMMNT